MTGQAQASEQLTLWDAIKDLGWFSWLFALIVAGPSVLSLGQSVFVEHRLIDALQWIVDGYNGIMDVLGGMFEPILQPILRWINARLNLSLELQPHWRPLFVLAMTYVMSFVRSQWRAKPAWGIEAALGLTPAALVGALLAGIAPLDGGWWVQGLIAAAPITIIAIFDFIRCIIQREENFLAIGMVLGVAMFAIAAALSFVPPLSAGAGLVTLAVGIFASGSMWLRKGLANGDRFDARMGLTVLGGFLIAAMIVAADGAVKTWGAIEPATLSTPAQ